MQRQFVELYAGLYICTAQFSGESPTTSLWPSLKDLIEKESKQEESRFYRKKFNIYTI